MLRQDAVHDVLVDVDPERLRDDACNTGAPEPRIARFELDDGTDEGLARSLRAGLLRPGTRGKQSAVLPTHQGLMKGQERRGTHPDGDLPDPPRSEEQRPDSAHQTVSHRRFGARWRGRRSTINCCLSRRFSATTVRTPPGPQSSAPTRPSRTRTPNLTASPKSWRGTICRRGISKSTSSRSSGSPCRDRTRIEAGGLRTLADHQAFSSLKLVVPITGQTYSG